MAKSIQQKYGFENPFKPDPLTMKAIRFFNGTKGLKLLDAGCGEGADSVFYAKKGFKVTALDLNKEYLKRLRAYCSDQQISNISIRERSCVTFQYPKNSFDIVSSILVVCCIKRSEFEKMVGPLKRSVKPGGLIVMSARNYLDPEFRQYKRSEKSIEPNTYCRKEGCCQYVYFFEKGRLREVFSGFEILYYHEGFAPCKYNEHPKHGDSYIICRRTV